MKKVFSILFFYLFCLVIYGQNTFEKAKLEILCQAIRFSHTMQGKADVANKIDCSSIETLSKTLPNASRASKDLLLRYRGKTYPQVIDETEKIQQLKKEVLAEIRKLAPRISKSADFQAKWQQGVDSLSAVLEQKLLLPSDESSQNNPTPNVENKNTELEETIIPYERNTNKLPAPEASSNTGLWIISILAVLISFLSVGYAYLTQKTTAHKLKEMENLLKERYHHLDVRMDKMLTREEFRKHNPMAS